MVLHKQSVFTPPNQYRTVFLVMKKGLFPRIEAVDTGMKMKPYLPPLHMSFK